MDKTLKSIKLCNAFMHYLMSTIALFEHDSVKKKLVSSFMMLN